MHLNSYSSSFTGNTFRKNLIFIRLLLSALEITSAMAIIDGLCSSMSAFSSTILLVKVSALVCRHCIADVTFCKFGAEGVLVSF